MGYKIGYSGPEVDKLLKKAFDSSVVNNGWVKLSSNENEPCNLDILTTQGNYSISYWSNGPAQLTTNGPINVSVTKNSADNSMYQTIYESGKVYIRKGDLSGFTNTWMELQRDTEITVDNVAPINPQDNHIWIDTNNTPPVIKIFNVKTNAWMSIAPNDMAEESIYDSKGVKRDFEEFIAEKIEEANLANAANIYEKHLVEGEAEDNPIHVTSEEKAEWLSAVSNDTADTILSDFEDEMYDVANAKINERLQYINGELTTDIDTAESNMNKHINDDTIHITSEQRDTFNSKAAGDHTHVNDGRVTVSTDNLIGQIPIERIDPSVIERCHIINSVDEMLSLTSTDVQNGDTIYIDNESPSAWFVIDDSKLGTSDAFIQYSSPLPELAWENIANKPTSISGYDNNYYSSDDINSLYEEIKALYDKTQENLDSVLDVIGDPNDLVSIEDYKASLNRAIALNKKLDYLILDLGLSDEETSDIINRYKNGSIKCLTPYLAKTVAFTHVDSEGNAFEADPIEEKYFLFDLIESTIYGKRINLDELCQLGQIKESPDNDGYYELTGFTGDGVESINEEFSEDYIVLQSDNEDKDYMKNAKYPRYK